MASIFVYGTLRQGFPNEHILTKIGGNFEDALIKGSYVNTGWGVELGCLALQLDEEGEWINGQIFTSENLENHWDFLDEFEGEEYRRVKADVKLLSGQTKTAYVYVAVHHD